MAKTVVPGEGQERTKFVGGGTITAGVWPTSYPQPSLIVLENRKITDLFVTIVS